MSRNHFGRKTSPGFADPASPVATGEAAASPARETRPSDDAVVVQPPTRVTPEPAQGLEAGRITSQDSRTPLLDVEVVREQMRSPRPEPVRRCYEIWTLNTVYVLDARMRCVEVSSPATGEAKADHPLLGARLVGGQTQLDGAVEMSYPLPRPGSVAVFESVKNQRRHFSRTSEVERVVLRARIVTLLDGHGAPNWEKLAGPVED
ncbi:MAG: hypothetical protein PVI30_13315 [Myxococcales bacterium]